MRVRKVGAALVLLALLLPVFSGCSRNAGLEKDLVKVCQAYTEEFAAKKWDDCKKRLTGQALTEFELSETGLQALSGVETALSEFKGKLVFLNRPKDRAAVECSWVQEQSASGSPAMLSQVTVAYDLVKQNDRWLISGMKILSSEKGGAAE